MQELSIKVNIADRQYPLKIQLDDEENLRKAAKRINERLKDYFENYSVQDKQDALAMIALEFATEMFTETDKNKSADHSTIALVQEIETLIGQALQKH